MDDTRRSPAASADVGKWVIGARVTLRATTRVGHRNPQPVLAHDNRIMRRADLFDKARQVIGDLWVGRPIVRDGRFDCSPRPSNSTTRERPYRAPTARLGAGEAGRGSAAKGHQPPFRAWTRLFMVVQT